MEPGPIQTEDLGGVERPGERLNRRWTMSSVPQAEIGLGHFAMATSAIEPLQAGEVLLRNRMLSVSPANRAWMKAETYQAQLQPGQMMPGFGLGEVVESRAASLAPGDLVEGRVGWQEYAVVSAQEVRPCEKDLPMETLMALTGQQGLTAYYGLVDIARLRPGETVVVSAAAGAVGSLAAQIARIAGCRVVGIAGGRDKCRWLLDTLRLDGAVDYKAPGLVQALECAAPQGVDVFFDNTGGEVFEAVLPSMATGGRIAVCGSVAHYAAADPHSVARRIPTLVVGKRLAVLGFVVDDMPARHRDAARRALLRWADEGRLVVATHIVDGFEQLPQALLDLLNGANKGKVAVRL